MKCVRCGDYGELARGRATNGQWQYFYWCFRCGRRTGTRNFPHASVARPESLPIAWDRIGQGEVRICERCGATASVELHHWAPRAWFDDADEWPTSYLCQPCHTRWHQIVTPHISNPTVISAIIAALPPDSPCARALRMAELRRKQRSAEGKGDAA